jgi:dUTPase
VPLKQQQKKEASVLTGVIDPDYPGEIELLLHNRDKEEYA